MKQGKLTKISNNQNALRTKEIEGEFLDLPESGFGFQIVGKALDTTVGDARLVYTSKIRDVIKSKDPNSGNDIYEFRTLNSEYKLEVYEKVSQA